MYKSGAKSLPRRHCEADLTRFCSGGMFGKACEGPSVALSTTRQAAEPGVCGGLGMDRSEQGAYHPAWLPQGLEQPGDLKLKQNKQIEADPAAYGL